MKRIYWSVVRDDHGNRVRNLDDIPSCKRNELIKISESYSTLTNKVENLLWHQPSGNLYLLNEGTVWIADKTTYVGDDV